MEFSMEVQAHFSDALEFLEQGHYFIEWRGLFYDAECTEGVPNFKELPYFQRKNLEP